MNVDPTFRDRLLAKQAGLFDGVRTLVFLDSAGLSMVGHHEQIHERVAHFTPDGRLLLTTTLLLDSPNLEYHARRNVADNRNMLLNDSRFAHECFATYLSIQHLPIGDMPRGLELLDDEYSEYYDRIASYLDNHAHSSYLRYMLAWGLCAACFSSPAIRRIKGTDLLSPTVLAPSENPSLRLQRYLQNAPIGILEEIIGTATAQVKMKLESDGSSPWDIQSEAQWIVATQATLVEGILSDVSFEYFSKYMDGGCVSDDESAMSRR